MSGELRLPTASSTVYDLRGRFMPSSIESVAVSPKGDRIFLWSTESGGGVGYISSFTDDRRSSVVSVPFTDVNISWPEENTLTINTKGTAYGSGILYSIDPRTNTIKKILGGIRGLSTLMNKNASLVLVSGSSGQSINTSVYKIKDGSSSDTVFRTLAEKCVWSALRTEELYCAVPTEIPSGTYPDDWYQGKISFVDQIWHLNTTTGEIHLIAKLLTDGGSRVDAINLTLDPKENFLYFQNKRDLSLWSVDLND
jgi:hypothetical protein